jgi:hypothetical protein
MRIDHLVFAVIALATACGLTAPPGEYGSEWTNEGAPDASSEEDGG